MPLRDYKCNVCGAVHEHYVAGFEADKTVPCSSCGSENTFIYYGNHRLRFNGFGRSKQLDGSEMTTYEIDKKCKAENSHYLSQADQERTVDYYKKQREVDEKRTLEKKVEKEMKVLKQRGVY